MGAHLGDSRLGVVPHVVAVPPVEVIVLDDAAEQGVGPLAVHDEVVVVDAAVGADVGAGQRALDPAALEGPLVECQTVLAQPHHHVVEEPLLLLGILTYRGE